MPTSFEQQSSVSPSTYSAPSKSSQKTPSTDVQLPTKTTRNNKPPKDNGGAGGIFATVTRNKMPATKSAVLSVQAQTSGFDAKSKIFSTNGHLVTPLIATPSPASSDKSDSTNTECGSSIPSYSTSPNNLINLGESPPNFQMGGKLADFGSKAKEQRGIINGYPTSASNPTNRRRPCSYQIDGTIPQNPDDHRSPISSYGTRRSSMYSQKSRFPHCPPLPHQTQAHFYSAPDANLLLSPPAPGLVPGDGGYHCGFDTMSKDHVVVAGYEGGVRIYAVSKKGLTKISSIDGLRGGVYNAKIIPWSHDGFSSHHYPLIALVIHGPVYTTNESAKSDDVGLVSGAISPYQSENSRASPPLVSNKDIEYYQTSVEVYSLAGTKQHVATLLYTPKTHVSMPTTSPLFQAPAPVGALTIRADSGNLIVASGTTGEIWVYRPGNFESKPQQIFKFIGKVWTTVQYGVTVEAAANGMEGDWQKTEAVSVRKQCKASVLSLNGRWLAYCPPNPSSQVSLQAVVPGTNSTTRIPGLNMHTPPQLPGVNCGVDTPGEESMVKQIVQIGTQKFIEASNYLAHQGMQAWTNYRNKPSTNAQPTNGGSMNYQGHASIAQQFPPTHGLPTPAPLVTKEPGLISILDLDSLAQYPTSTASSPHPMSTFRVPYGCSFLSFAPNGLALFTASRKGDVQIVWDLMRIQHAKSSLPKSGSQRVEAPDPHVRQIAQFSRMTIARIVDVVWTCPHGERAAMVTEPGTIHILDLPASAFTWPPPRRRNPTRKSTNPNDEVVGPTITATGVATSAVSSLWTAARPLVSRRRRSSSGISARTMTAQAGHGTQVLAAGISRSVGAATGKMNEMRKSGGTKLHLPRNVTAPTRACVLLLEKKRTDSVVALGGGVVRWYTIKNRRADLPADKQKASVKTSVEFRIPSLPNYLFAPGSVGTLNPVSDLELTERDIEEIGWKTGQLSPPRAPIDFTESSIPQAEIESNAPYQPFHTDRRVELHIFSYEDASLPSPSISASLSPATSVFENQPTTPRIQAKSKWVFGCPIKTTKLEVGPPYDPEDDFDESLEHRVLPASTMERVMKISDSTEDMEQIVITTRRRKTTSRPGTDEASGEFGFFEDDCEVLDFASQRV